MPSVIIIYLISIIIRLNIFNESRDNWAQAVVIPFSTIIMCFIPITLPFTAIIAEAVSLADILATSEASLRKLTNQTNDVSILKYFRSIVTNSFQRKPKSKLETTKDTSNLASSHIQSNINIDIDIEEPNIDQESVSSSSSSSSSSKSEVDEFLDEDIDDRAEEIAEEANTRVLWIRLLQYIVIILSNRLSLPSVYRFIKYLSNNKEYLPIPMIRARLLETLGAVTKVCFVDDDIIFEDYSVTEEIFLLMSSDKDANSVSTAKGTIVDLHANPEASGSRFENPLWWKYLPSLKPIGLNAMLTYKSVMSTESYEIHSDVNKSLIRATTDSVLQKKQSKKHSLNRGMDNLSIVHQNNKQSITNIELDLVRHVRKTIPQESLKELAEEIGFINDDINIFDKLLELIVMAPRLGNSQFLEDTHAWGQEETRRRGTLLSHVRSSIVQDSRGGIQMMSHGDPALILKYCTEYWDGASIAPLSQTDREEVLKVYDRYRKEDFDVTSFSYSPIPVAFQPLILQSVRNYKESSNMKVVDMPCLLFVDPSTSQELEKSKDKKLANSIDNEHYDSITHNNIPIFGTPPKSSSMIDFTVFDNILTNHNSNNNNITTNEDEDKSNLFDPVYLSPSISVIDENLLNKRTSLSYKLKSRPLSDSNLSKSINQFTPFKYPENEALTREMNEMDSLTDDIVLDVCNDGDSNNIDKTNSNISKKNISNNIYEDIDVDSPILSLRNRFNTLVNNQVNPNNSSNSLRRANSLDSLISSQPVENISNQFSRDDYEYDYEVPVTNYLIKSNDSNTNSFMSTAVVSFDNSNGNAATNQLSDSIARENNNQADNDNDNDNNTAMENKKRSLGAHLWPLMRQQVFLGLAASSVPVKKDVPNLREDLTSAGVRFVYFSPRNMRRSKPVAEKIGIQFDWNCAISLRKLDGEEYDPHRYISSYADWDVHARMPHGIDAIKKHLQVVDNVPLLVSLYTDATPSSICDMINVFRSYGEVVLSIGSSYRTYNQSIFHESDLGIGIAMIPGSNSHIPSSVYGVISKVPSFSQVSLCQIDLLLTFRLVGIRSVPLLQLPYNFKDKLEDDIRLSAVIESIRKGRLFLLNIFQGAAFLCVATLSIALWSVIAQAIPISVAPSLPPLLGLLFLFFYIPVIIFSILLSDTSEGIMKNTPRKSILTLKPVDERKFLSFFLFRCGYIVLSLFIQGWVTSSSTFARVNSTWQQRMVEIVYINLNNKDTQSLNDIYGYWLIQDVISIQLLFQILVQAATLMERGQTIMRLPTPFSHPQFYFAVILSLFTQFWVMLIRAYGRNEIVGGHSHTFIKLDWIVWVLLFVLPMIGLAIGIHINQTDFKGYKRYLQFLRLNFDTKLGMHSPR